MVNVSMVNFVSSEVIADGTDTLAGVLPRILIDVSTANVNCSECAPNGGTCARAGASEEVTPVEVKLSRALA